MSLNVDQNQSSFQNASFFYIGEHKNESLSAQLKLIVPVFIQLQPSAVVCLFTLSTFNSAGLYFGCVLYLCHSEVLEDKVQ